jgi:hypothetical protein
MYSMVKEELEAAYDDAVTLPTKRACMAGYQIRLPSVQGVGERDVRVFDHCGVVASEVQYEPVSVVSPEPAPPPERRATQ